MSEQALTRARFWRPKPKPPWWWQAAFWFTLRIVLIVALVVSPERKTDALHIALYTALIVTNGAGMLQDWKQLLAERKLHALEHPYLFGAQLASLPVALLLTVVAVLQ